MLSFILLGSFLILFSCKKLVEVPAPVTQLTSDNVYSNNATAAAVLTGIYTEMATIPSTTVGTLSGISLGSALSADELTLFGGSANGNVALSQMYLNKLTAGLPTGISVNATGPWADCYNKIYIVNIALERLAISSSLTPTVRQQLIGEAKFMRAFFYFYLVNLYGDVPLTTTSDYTVNAVIARSPQALVYRQIITDLISAQSLLGNGYVAADAMTSTSERVRPNRWAATALLARVYLYSGDWADAVKEATAVINNTSTYSLDPLNTTFLKNSSETIWSLQPVNLGWNTEDARVFILPLTGPNTGTYPVYLSPQLLNSFEPGDQRSQEWVDSVNVGGVTYYYPYKYKSATLNASVTEYTMVLRLGEQYLIRAEAEAENNDIGDAITDLNAIRSRASLPAYAGATDRTSLLAAILHERQVELFTEWGHRWMDLKRTGNVDAVMTTATAAKGTSWNPDWAWYPLPLYDITQDPKLSQNPGY